MAHCGTQVARAYERIGNAKAKVGDLAGAIEAYDKSLVESHNDKVRRRCSDEAHDTGLMTSCRRGACHRAERAH